MGSLSLAKAATREDVRKVIALKTGIDYAVIDYTLTCGDLMTEGNYSIDKRARVIRRL
jgi:hypothetical protein